MVVEHFKNRDAAPVYRRFRDSGRMAPEGLRYVSSWVDEKLERCYQLMETSDRRLLDEWMPKWSDLVEFEVYPVITSQQAARESTRDSRPVIRGLCANAPAVYISRLAAPDRQR